MADGRYDLGIKFIQTDERQIVRWEAFCHEILNAQAATAHAISFDEDVSQSPVVETNRDAPTA